MIRIASIFLLLISIQCFAETWYASSDGTSTNGTYNQPWGPQYAVTNTNPFLLSGDTVVFKAGGTFVCRETNSVWEIGQVLEFRKSGTPTGKITYRPETLWGFSFDGGLLIPPGISNLVLRDFRIFHSGITSRNRTNIYEMPAGIVTLGVGVDILHNLIENTGHPGIASWSTTKGKYIAGNIIRFVGYNDWTDKSAGIGGGNWNGGERGSGLYLQNEDNSSEALIQGNISYFNYTTGMKAYGSANCWGFKFVENVCVDVSEGIFYHLDDYGSDGLTVSSNYTWLGGLQIGYPLGNGGHSNAIVTDNYIVANVHPFYQADGWINCTWTNNIGVKGTDRYVWQMEVSGEASGDTTSHHIDWNSYYGVNSGSIGSGPFNIKEVNKSLDQWRSEINGDTNSSFSYGSPNELTSFAFIPSIDSNFVHVVVFNWPTNTTTDVDLSDFYSVGDALSIYDAQNIPTAYTNLTYVGGNISLDLSLTNRVEMLGEFTQRSDTWAGFDPRFRAFVIHRTGNARALNIGTLRAQNLILR